VPSSSEARTLNPFHRNPKPEKKQAPHPAVHYAGKEMALKGAVPYGDRRNVSWGVENPSRWKPAGR